MAPRHWLLPKWRSISYERPYRPRRLPGPPTRGQSLWFCPVAVSPLLSPGAATHRTEEDKRRSLYTHACARAGRGGMAATGLPGLWLMAGSSRAASAGRGRALPVINRTRLPPLPPLPPLSKMISIYYTRRKDAEKIQQNAPKIAKICCFLASQGTCGANVGCGLFQYPRKSRKHVPYFLR